MFFHIPSLVLALGLLVVIAGAALAGLAIGHSRRESGQGLKESSGVLQGALLGFMGLILAFGLSLALGRYENRREAVVDDANTIGTTYLRAQTLTDPVRSRSMSLLKQYADAEVRLTDEVPGSDSALRTSREGEDLQRQLWALATREVTAHPTASAPRLYEESLNEMIDQQEVRIAGLGNRVPTEVLLLEIIGSAIAMFLLGLHVGLLGRGLTPLLLAAGLVTMLLFVTFDLDRPTRGWIKIPDTPLTSLRTSMNEAPPADGTTG